MERNRRETSEIEKVERITLKTASLQVESVLHLELSIAMKGSQKTKINMEAVSVKEQNDQKYERAKQTCDSPMQKSANEDFSMIKWTC